MACAPSYHEDPAKCATHVSQTLACNSGLHLLASSSETPASFPRLLERGESKVALSLAGLAFEIRGLGLRRLGRFGERLEALVLRFRSCETGESVRSLRLEGPGDRDLLLSLREGCRLCLLYRLLRSGLLDRLLRLAYLSSRCLQGITML